MKATEDGLGKVVDELLPLNPDFVTVREINDLDDDNFELREYKTPAGYSATTRVHMGRLCIPTLTEFWGHLLLYY